MSKKHKHVKDGVCPICGEPLEELEYIGKELLTEAELEGGETRLYDAEGHPRFRVKRKRLAEDGSESVG